MTEVTSPNQPSNGVVRWKVNACFQSTAPEKIGMTAERNASVAEPAAMLAARSKQLLMTKFKGDRLTMALARRDNA